MFDRQVNCTLMYFCVDVASDCALEVHHRLDTDVEADATANATSNECDRYDDQASSSNKSSEQLRLQKRSSLLFHGRQFIAGS